MAEPVRVLHVFGKLNMGGAETRVMDLYRHVDRTKVQFDFLVHHRITDADRKVIADDSSEELAKVREEEDFDAEARSLGARIYVLPRFTGRNLREYRRACENFFDRHHDFAAVEGHMTSMAAVYLPIAKKAGVPVTIAHARSAGVDAGIRGAATRWFRRSLWKKCDVMMSCSGPASLSVFGQKAVDSGKILMVPNAIDTDAFRFDPSAREAMRVKYGIADNTVVIGHVGRFDAVKNQKFLALLGSLLIDKLQGNGISKSILFLLLGQGNLQEEVQKAFDDAGLSDAVVFAGQMSREDTAAAYSAFDIFALPSLYEGLPGTVIEAQATGLPCVIADTITEEVALTDLVRRLPLDQPEKWVDVLAEMIRSGNGESDRKKCSGDARKKLDDAGYNVVTEAIRLQELYLKMAGRPRLEEHLDAHI